MDQNPTTPETITPAKEEESLLLKQHPATANQPVLSVNARDLINTIREDYIKVLLLRLELASIKQKLIDSLLNIYKKENENLEIKLNNYLCAICMENYRTCVLEPCCHFICCENCITKMLNNNCPVCRTKCTFYIKTFNI